MFSHKEGASDNIFDRYEVNLKRKYGEGGYGATFAAVDKVTNEQLAVKLIDTRRMRPEAIKKECEILEVLNHPNVISVKAHSKGRGQHEHIYFIFMELAGGGELFDQVIDRGANAMPEPMARGFFNQILDGVAYCHVAGVAHRDLKLENVLLNAQGVVKLIDFGLSHVYPRLADKSIDRSKPLRDVCGSKSYAAPEVLAARGYDGFVADMWSVGVCLFAMLSGFFPLDEASKNDWRYPKLIEGQQSGRSTVASVYGWYKRSCGHLSREVVHLLDQLLLIDPSKRLTMDGARSHPWVLERKIEPTDQGSYNAFDIVTDDAPVFRGMGALPGDDHFEPMTDEDDMPVCAHLCPLPHGPRAQPARARPATRSRVVCVCDDAAHSRMAGCPSVDPGWQSSLGLAH